MCPSVRRLMSWCILCCKYAKPGSSRSESVEKIAASTGGDTLNQKKYLIYLNPNVGFRIRLYGTWNKKKYKYIYIYTNIIKYHNIYQYETSSKNIYIYIDLQMLISIHHIDICHSRYHRLSFALQHLVKASTISTPESSLKFMYFTFIKRLVETKKIMKHGDVAIGCNAWVQYFIEIQGNAMYEILQQPIKIHQDHPNK